MSTRQWVHLLVRTGALALWAAAALAPATLERMPGVVPTSRFLEFSAEALAEVENPHSYRGLPACPVCHQGDTPALVSGPTELCKGCHEFNHRNSHPVDVKQRADIGDSLPLGDEGEVRCHTCHDVHDVTRHRYGLRMEFTPLCLICHPWH